MRCSKKAKNRHSITSLTSASSVGGIGKEQESGSTGSQDWDKERWRQRGWDQSRAATRFGSDDAFRRHIIFGGDPIRNPSDALVVGIIGGVDECLIRFDCVL
jgi:hypothetical protein